jgi:hypothetical protein
VVPADHGALPRPRHSRGLATKVDPAAKPCKIRMVWPDIEVKESATPCGSPEGGALWLWGLILQEVKKKTKNERHFHGSFGNFRKFIWKKIIFSKRFAKNQNNPSMKI